MKKSVYIILGFIIGAVLTYYFCPRPDDSETTKMAETKIVKPSGVISVEDAIGLNDNWTEFRKQAVDSAAERQGRKVDKRSVGWSVADVRNYLDWAEIESRNFGYSMDSIRVYLGIYGKEQGEENEGFSTMFIAPIGQKLTSEASSLPLITSMRSAAPVGPLNDGSGGGSYP